MSYPTFQVPAGDVLPIMFTSYAGSTGASVTLTGLAVTDIEIYKDGSATQRSSDAGYTLLDTDGIDFDGITGVHGFSIDTGDNTDAGFYTVGAWFTVVVSAVTVDAQTVNFIAAQFRVMAAEAEAGVPLSTQTTTGAVAAADALLNRDMATGTDSGSASVRTVRQALRALRNRWTNSSGTYTVYKENDSTTSWTSTTTGDAAADPVVESNPAD